MRIRKRPAEEELDGIRVGELRPGSVCEVSASIGTWLIAERYAVPEMRREFHPHQEDFLAGRDTADDYVRGGPRRRFRER